MTNDNTLLSLVDGLFERSGDYAKRTRKILATQHRLQELCEADAWIAFLDVEQAVMQYGTRVRSRKATYGCRLANADRLVIKRVATPAS